MSTGVGFLTSAPTEPLSSDINICLSLNGDDYALGMLFTAPGSGTLTITEIGVWMYTDEAGGYSDAAKLGIFSWHLVDEEFIEPDTLVTNSETPALDVPYSTEPELVNYIYDGTKPQLTGGADYFIIINTDRPTNDETYLNANIGGPERDAAYNYPTFPSWPETWFTGSSCGMDVSVYAVYEEGGATGHPARKRLGGNPFTPFRKGVW